MKIIMVDQDGVIVDREYKTNCDIRLSVQTALKTTYLVPNSGTPLKRLRTNFQDWLGFFPNTLIAEQGAIVSHDSSDFCTVEINGISEYIELFQKKLRNIAKIYIGDSATWIRDKRKFQPNSEIIIIDQYRQQSVSFYSLVTDQRGDTYIDNGWSQLVLSALKKIALPIGLNFFNYDREYGIAVASPEGANKTIGYNFLKKLLPNPYFYMIGDSDADVIDDPEVIHCAVANASEKLKQKAAFVADKNYTAGLEECLNWIIGQ